MTARPVRRDEWASIVDSDPDAFLTHTPRWMDCLVELGGYEDASRLYEMADGRRMVLPLARRTRLPGWLAVHHSLPATWGYSGLVGDPLHPADVAQVVDDLRALGGASVSIRPSPAASEVWDAGAPPSVGRSARATHLVDLRDGFESVWTNRIKTKTRTKVRRAERVGVVVERDNTGAYVDAFYDLYLGWLAERAERHNLPKRISVATGRHRELRRKFEVVAAAFPDNCITWIALIDDQPIASCIQLVHGAHSLYWRGFSDRTMAGKTKANYLLQKLMLEEAAERGCQCHHLGESGGVETLMQFKEAFGAVRHDYHVFTLERLPVNRAHDLATGWRSQVESRLSRS